MQQTKASEPTIEKVFWYRFQETYYAAPVDEFDQPYGEGTVEVKLQKYVVVRETLKGVWLVMQWGDFTGTEKKFVLVGSNKRYACPTIEEAYDSFMARKLKQISIYKARIKGVEKAIHAAESLKDQNLDS